VTEGLIRVTGDMRLRAWDSYASARGASRALLRAMRGAWGRFGSVSIADRGSPDYFYARSPGLRGGGMPLWGGGKRSLPGAIGDGAREVPHSSRKITAPGRARLPSREGSPLLEDYRATIAHPCICRAFAPATGQ
jgi:hypothetical protein